MKIIKHRVNTIEQLMSTPKEYGVEIDVRYHANDLILSHDPFNHHSSEQTTLEKYLKFWSHSGPIILNLKSEGLEEECIQIMKFYDINNWFFLDLSMPYFVKFSAKTLNNQISNFSPNNLAVRFSDKEPIEYALSFSGKVSWVWLDLFDDFPLTQEIFIKLKKSAFKICVVSPELQNYPIDRTKSIIKKCKKFEIDAVCTKIPKFWD